MTERPLKNLSDEELIQLWELSNELSCIGQGQMDGYLTGVDVANIRMTLLCQMKLCEKYGIPYPKPETEWAEVQGYSTDEEDCEDEFLEFQDENLHKYIREFSDIGGIGDFKVDYLQNPDILLNWMKEHGLGDAFDKMRDNDVEEALCKPGILKDLVREGEDEDGNSLSDFYAEEFDVPGYLELLSLIFCNGGTDYWSLDEFTDTSSEKMQKLFVALEPENASIPAETQGKILKLLKAFSLNVVTGRFFYINIERTERVDEGGRWCMFSAMVNHSEDGCYTCDLHRNTCLRVGAYVVQEFADRYAAA